MSTTDPTRRPTEPEMLTLERAVETAHERVRKTHAACKRIEGTKRHGSPEHLRRVVESSRAAVAYYEAQLARSKAILRSVEELMAAKTEAAHG